MDSKSFHPMDSATMDERQQNYVGGKLLPKVHDTWALFFSKYLDAIKRKELTFGGLQLKTNLLEMVITGKVCIITPKK